MAGSMLRLLATRYRWVSNPSLHPEYKQAVKDVLEKFTYGDTITKEWVQARLGIVFPALGTQEQMAKIQVTYMTRMESLRNELLVDHSMHLVTKHNKGFVICMPGQQTKAAMDKYKGKFVKETQRAVKVLNNVNTSMLSQEAVQERDSELNNIAAIAAFSGKRLTDM